MSFLNIKDPLKRDAIVAEYLATVKRLQKRNIDERSKDLARVEAIQQNLEPVVRSTDESTAAITDQLIPIKEQITTLNNNLANGKYGGVDEKEKETGEEESVLPASFIENIYQRVSKDKLDKYFGIVKDINGYYKMGDKIVHIDGSDIIVDNERYEGTQGFWNLVMMRSPKNTYTSADLRNYRDLIEQTNAVNAPNNLTPHSNVKVTTKWQRIFPLFDTMHHEQTWESKDGDGIVRFLPGDIKGLQTKLCYLRGEFRAGNTTTREEIVPISDELLRRKKISAKEYKEINNFLRQ